MARRVRQMIKIDEEKCNGCGQCVIACAEGAMRIVDGKAKLVSETYCDGLGACIGDCPLDAITIETREADEFDEEATVAHLTDIGLSPEAHYAHMAEHAMGGHAHGHHGHHGHDNGHDHGHDHDHDHSHDHGHDHDHGPAHSHGGGFACPSAKTIDRRADDRELEAAPASQIPSELRQWPVKLYLVNPTASFLQDSDLLLAADCTAFTYGAFHPDLLRGKTLVTGCPKFDDTQLYADKLTQILRQNDVRSITVVKMEVPCCSGLVRLAEMGVEASGKHVPVRTVTIGLTGELTEEPAALTA